MESDKTPSGDGMRSELLSASGWKDYELLDSGRFEKLERFGRYVLARPEPQAVWDRSLSEDEWRARADAVFRRDGRSGEPRRVDASRGHARPLVCGIRRRNEPEIPHGAYLVQACGAFPEQAENWEFIFREVRRLGAGARVLNLFAYTGGASLAARAAGADVTHVRFGQTGGELGPGEYGGFGHGRNPVDRGGCAEVRPPRSEAGPPLRRHRARSAGLRPGSGRARNGFSRSISTRC